ncbi:MAG TPA: hypothetical protein VI912_04745 [Candidatus Bilamarchaeaceae archaeon]|nr:hypothetical protein [Candidatus Bilamarchaeaceae archaeon]
MTLEVTIKRIKEEGLDFFDYMMRDEDKSNPFYYLALNDLKEPLVSMLIKEGEKAQNDPAVFEKIFKILGNEKTVNRLLLVMESKTAEEILTKVVSTKSGEFLVLGCMRYDYSKAHAFVNKLLQKRDGRKLAVSILLHTLPIDNKAENSGIVNLSDKGKFFSDILSLNTQELVGSLLDQEKSDNIIQYLKDNPEEATKILEKKLSDSKSFSNIINALQNPECEKFCALVGKTGFGRNFGAEKLWLTKGGRNFVHEMLKSEFGAYAIYGIMAGMTVGEFIAYTAPLGKQ